VDELGDRAVEQLVAVRPGLEHVVVDVAHRHRPQDRLGSGTVGPRAPRHEQRTPGVGVHGAHPAEQLPAGQVGQPLVGEHGRHRVAAVPGRLQLLEGSSRGQLAAHAEVTAEPALQVGLDA